MLVYDFLVVNFLSTYHVYTYIYIKNMIFYSVL